MLVDASALDPPSTLMHSTQSCWGANYVQIANNIALFLLTFAINHCMESRSNNSNRRYDFMVHVADPSIILIRADQLIHTWMNSFNFLSTTDIRVSHFPNKYKLQIHNILQCFLALDIIQVDGHVKIRHKNLSPGNFGWLRSANRRMLFGGFPDFGLPICLFDFPIENIYPPLWHPRWQ